MASILRNASRFALRAGSTGASAGAAVLSEVARRLRGASDEPGREVPVEHADRPRRLEAVRAPQDDAASRRAAAASAGSAKRAPSAERSPVAKQAASAGQPTPADDAAPAAPQATPERSTAPRRPTAAERTGSTTARSAGGRITKPKAARKVRQRAKAERPES